MSNSRACKSLSHKSKSRSPESTSRKLPKGHYRTRIEHAELEVSDGAIKLRLLVFLRVVQGPYQGALIRHRFPIIETGNEAEFDQCMLNHNARSPIESWTPTKWAKAGLKSFLDICDVDTSGLLPRDFTDSLRGKVVIADVERGRVLTFSPIEDE